MTTARWIVSGKLEVLTPLSIRTGYQEQEPPAPVDGPLSGIEPNAPANAVPQGVASPIIGIELDDKQRPYVPATAIKGLLRNRAAASLPEEDMAILRALLGDQPAAGRDKNDAAAKVAKGGFAEFRNAFIADDPNSGYRPTLRGRTALHEGSLTAEGGQLRQERAVAPGTTFAVEIVVCRADEAQVALLLGLLTLIDGLDASSALGAGTSQGDGRVKWSKGDIRRFGTAEAKAWQFAAAEKTWQDFARPAPIAPREIRPQPDRRVTLAFTLPIEGHFLVGAMEVVKNAEGNNVLRKRPLRLHGGDDKTARLPGSSLDGALRAQARRIFRTIAGDFRPWEDDDIKLPAGFASLFGSAAAGSLLECEEFSQDGLALVEQEFVAIDRLSGGGADEKKFSMRAFEAPQLTGKIHLVLHRRTNPALTGKPNMTSVTGVTPEAIGLLALVLKDLACGDVPLGAATRKGYGGVGGLIFGNGGWPELLEHLGEQVLLHAADIPALEPFRPCLTGREVIETAVALLHAEARAWKAKRPADEEVEG